ncbi:uncharacterized protein AMSG_06232 [Thecamonas trahens ATCC 50062]|uniref:LIM zinc-binding domain-containing protein n=1 Tax=Thecamonas trahens ATCC 50062 TaxID=461836 RepID=A0A0L0DC62_THETB|nr:hypothetical protein AMSG_06232 [Thecamonas trahens ATCC 50062]KNC49927.1 hypothetical protein AMSG_06232 [Thecamonas trahens ATCC 50062]|eukprot:XP_013757406.1 hypothetical protein AMSG_06232 [Thecamonas trahens ATCC 50062]
MQRTADFANPKEFYAYSGHKYCTTTCARAARKGEDQPFLEAAEAAAAEAEAEAKASAVANRAPAASKPKSAAATYRAEAAKSPEEKKAAAAAIAARLKASKASKSAAGSMTSARLCHGCKNELGNEYVTAGSHSFHSICLKCAVCRKAIDGAFGTSDSGNIVCATCFGADAAPADASSASAAPLCAGCGNAAAGDVVDALDALWHPACFICSLCSSELGTRFAVNASGKPVCNTCWGS